VVSPEQILHADLTDAERFVLTQGLAEWGGPAHCTDAMARAMGFRDVANLFEDGGRIARDLHARRPLSRRDWTRALLATEIVFASDVLGSGTEWPDTTGLDDQETLQTLRSIQYKLAGVVVRHGAWSGDDPA
jgi:hypothetical protein